MPIGCAGVAVYPGDVLVGDRDGVLVIPRHLAAEIAEQGLEQEQLEAYVSTKIHAGEPLWGNYPPGEETEGRVQGLARRGGRPVPPNRVRTRPDGKEVCGDDGATRRGGRPSGAAGTAWWWSAAGSAA